MAIEFSKAVAYDLSYINQPDLLLKDKQEPTLRYLFEGRDVFAWFPTGYDKSLCVQLLPYMFDYKLGQAAPMYISDADNNYCRSHVSTTDFPSNRAVFTYIMDVYLPYFSTFFN